MSEEEAGKAGRREMECTCRPGTAAQHWSQEACVWRGQSRQARSYQRAQPGCLCMLMRQSRTASHTIAPSAQELTRLQNDGAQLPGWGGGDPLQRGLASRYPALTG